MRQVKSGRWPKLPASATRVAGTTGSAHHRQMRVSLLVLVLALALVQAAPAAADEDARPQESSPPWIVPPPKAPSDPPSHGLQIPTAAVASFKLLTGPRPLFARRFAECRSAADDAARARGVAGIDELVARIRSAATMRARIGAASALATPLPTPDDTWLGLPPGVGDCGVWSFDETRLRDAIEAQLREDSATTLDVLMSQLRHGRKSDRARAAWSLRMVSLAAEEPFASRASAALLGLEHDGVAGVRYAAIVLDDRAMDEAVEARLRRAAGALRDADPMVRHAGLVTLAWDDEPLPPRHLLPTLRRIARDPGELTPSRTLAAGLALRLQPTREELLIALRACPWFAEFGCDALSLAFDEHPDPLLAWSWEAALVPGPGQEHIVETVLSFDTALEVPRCRVLAQDPDPRIRELAIAALRRMGEATELEDGRER